MRLKPSTLLIIAICTTTFKAWSLDANGIKNCMAADAQFIRGSNPFNVELALTKWQLKSEIFYQFDANRNDLLENRYLKLEDYKTLNNEVSRVDDEYKRLMKEYDLLNPEPRRQQNEKFEEWINAANLHTEKRNQYSRPLRAPVMVAQQKLNDFEEQIRTSPKRHEYIREIESKLIETGDESNLKYFRVKKSYGDYLLLMIKRATSCDDLHTRYVKLAKEAKLKRNFEIEILSVTSFFDVSNIRPENQKKLTETVRENLEADGFEYAAKTFDLRRHKSVMIAGFMGSYARGMSLIINGKRLSEPVIAEEGRFQNRSMSSDELETLLSQEMRKGLMDRHLNAQEMVLSSIK